MSMKHRTRSVTICQISQGSPTTPPNRFNDRDTDEFLLKPLLVMRLYALIGEVIKTRVNLLIFLIDDGMRIVEWMEGREGERG